MHTNQDADRLAKQRSAVVTKLEALGFTVNRQNSMMGAAQQRVRYLGMLVDTAQGIAIVPDDKKHRILTYARPLVRTLASIKGQLVAISWAFKPWYRLHTRALGQSVETRCTWDLHHL